MFAVSDDGPSRNEADGSQRSVEGPALEATQVVKRYGEVIALDGVSLQVHRGEFLTLLGPSGSGKTTLLNAIAGFEGLDSGDLLFQGDSLLKTRPENRDFGFVFQSYALFPHMTIEDNVGYPLRLRGMRKADREKRIRETLELVELGHLAGRFPAQLSGGQQQRVAVARALAFQPRVLLMDEPLSALDRKLRTSLQFELKKLHDRLGLTIVFVTHDQEEALTMSDRIAVMRSGKIVQVGSPIDLYESPVSRFVADFLGENNFLPVSSVDSRTADVEVRLHGLDSALRVPRERVHVDDDSDESALSVRPEDISVGAAIGAPGTISARVTSAAFLGDSWRYECRITTGQTVLVKQVKKATALTEGSEVSLSFDPEKVSLFAVAFDSDQ